jgi:hypothetical protein
VSFASRLGRWQLVAQLGPRLELCPGHGPRGRGHRFPGGGGGPFVRPPPSTPNPHFRSSLRLLPISGIWGGFRCCSFLPSLGSVLPLAALLWPLLGSYCVLRAPGGSWGILLVEDLWAAGPALALRRGRKLRLFYPVARAEMRSVHGVSIRVMDSECCGLWICGGCGACSWVPGGLHQGAGSHRILSWVGCLSCRGRLSQDHDRPWTVATWLQPAARSEVPGSEASV